MASTSSQDPAYYVVTTQPPTTTSRTLMGQFTHLDDTRMLVLARGNRLVTHVVHPAGTELVSEYTVYGRIDVLEVIRPESKTYDLVFLGTDRHDCCLLQWEREHRKWSTIWSGSLTEPVGRLRDHGVLAAVDPRGRAIAVHAYQSVLQICPLSHQADMSAQRPKKLASKNKEAKQRVVSIGEMGEVVSFRWVHCDVSVVLRLLCLESVEELQILSMAFLNTDTITVAILYQDAFMRKHLKTYILPPMASMDGGELTLGPLNQPNVHLTATFLIPMIQGGVVIAGQSNISYRDSSTSYSLDITAARLEAYAVVDRSKVLLSDNNGFIHLMDVQCTADGTVEGLSWIQLGSASIASCLAYLGNGMAFVGSHSGDSMTVRLPAEPDSDGSLTPLEIIEAFTNVAPITDFEIVDYDKQGQGQMVTCSGIGKDGSLRIIRSGVGIKLLASLDLPGIEGIWSLRPSTDTTEERYLVLSFIGETRVIYMQSDGEMEEVDFNGIPIDNSTVFAGTVRFNQWLHVGPHAVRLVSAPDGRLIQQWDVPNKGKIHSATAVDQNVLISCSDGQLVCFTIGDRVLKEASKTKMTHEVACLCIHPTRPDLCAVGLWHDMSIHCMKLPGFEIFNTDVIGGEMILRSISFLPLADADYLLVTLGDGQLYHYVLDKSSSCLRDRRRFVVGTQPIHLASFKDVSGSFVVFASSDRPSIIYSSGKKLVYSPVDLKNVNRVCSFRSKLHGNALAMVDQNGLSLGRVDELRKLHIRKVQLSEQPRRLAHQEATKTFGVITAQTPTDSNSPRRSFFRLLDDQTFEVLDSYQMGNFELVQSVASITFMGETKPYYVVGTAFVFPGEEEPQKGRIIVFSVSEAQQIQLMTTVDVKGSVFAMCPFHGMILCGINSKVFLFKWSSKSARDEGPDLAVEAYHHGHIMALNLDARGDFVLVGDLMKSVTVLKYDPNDHKLVEVARDFNTNWMTAVAMLEDDVYIGAENGYNLFTLMRYADAVDEEKRRWLATIGYFHTGEFINRFRAGALVNVSHRQNNDGQQPIAIPKLIFGAVTGMIGIVATLKPETYRVLRVLQHNLEKLVKSIGGLDHRTFRNFTNERRSVEASGFIDGDLIETFLDLTAVEQSNAVSGSNVQGGKDTGLKVDEVVNMVEELSQLH